MRKPTIYIFMNKSLGMSAGKLAAQAAHVMASIPNLDTSWMAPHKTILIMQARDQQHMDNISTYLDKREVETFWLIDEGVNETDSHVATALATEIVDKDLETTRDIFSTFELYKDMLRFKIELDR